MRKDVLLFAVVTCALVRLALASPQDLDGLDRTVPTPLPQHPGNVFLAGEEVVAPLPGDWIGAWRVLDYDGRQVAEGKGPGKICLGKLPVGYYEIPRGEGKPPIGIAVLAPLAATTPETSPIGVDSSTPWSCGGQLAEVANLCALAGINWARGRLDWGQMEPKQGQFAPFNKYDAMARAFHNAGIQVLQVNHFTPPWAGPKKNRFPIDLRDAYRFYREMASRWKGQVQAFEPWNEADWPMFGGHTGAEMASLQKACFWGLKAGNPDAIVCQNVFANYFPQVIVDFHANEVWPCFDTLNFHHYWSLDTMPKYYDQFRQISGGRPIWVTECNFIHGLSAEGLAVDPKVREFTAEDLRRQAAHVLQILAVSIEEGSQATFWFMFPNYSEGETQFGVVRADLTPRPSYLALAAAGRLLADAKPAGTLRSANKELRGYFFRAKPDGKDQLVLVVWTKTGTDRLTLPLAPSAVFDTIGRERKVSATSLEATAAPVLALFPADTLARFDVQPPPAMRPRVQGKPCPVVLQAVWPAEKSTWPFVPGLNAHYLIGADGPERMPLCVYNFGQRPVTGALSVIGPTAWNLTVPRQVSLQPMERLELALNYDLGAVSHASRETVKIQGDFGPAGKAILSLRLLPELPSRCKATRDVPALMQASRWQSAGSRDARISISPSPDGVVVEIEKAKSGQNWANVSLNLKDDERPAPDENALVVPIQILQGQASLNVNFVEEKGERFSASYPAADSGANSVQGAVALGHLLTASTTSSPGRCLDPGRLRSVSIGIGQQKSDKLRFVVKRFAWGTFQAARHDALSGDSR